MNVPPTEIKKKCPIEMKNKNFNVFLINKIFAKLDY